MESLNIAGVADQNITQRIWRHLIEFCEPNQLFGCLKTFILSAKIYILSNFGMNFLNPLVVPCFFYIILGDDCSIVCFILCGSVLATRQLLTINSDNHFITSNIIKLRTDHANSVVYLQLQFLDYFLIDSL